MTEYKVFNIRCRNCKREGQLTIESDGRGQWDYVITGFSGTIHKDGPDLPSLECFRCNARMAALIKEDEDLIHSRVN